MTAILHIGDVLRANAHVRPQKLGARDLSRSMTFREWNARACRLANALLGAGLRQGDRIAVLAYNCVEWMEIYAAAAKAGIVAVPINFRLNADDFAYILGHSGARVVCAHPDYFDAIDGIRDQVPGVEHCVALEGARDGWIDYEAAIAAADPAFPRRRSTKMI